MPITQARMLALLDEQDASRIWTDGLVSDLRALLSAALSDSAKVIALGELVEDFARTRPDDHVARTEREHFAKRRTWNERSAQRMRKSRQKEQENGLARRS